MTTGHTWAYDGPTGTYKSHAMSRELFEASLEECVMMDFVRPIDSFGRKRGESVTLTRVSELSEPTSVDLTEGVRIPEDNISLTTTSITVTEIGRAIPYTSLANDLSRFDIDNVVQKNLRGQLRRALDTKVAAAFKQAKIKYVPTGLTSATVTTNGTAGTTALANLNVYHLEEIRDLMYDTYRVPPYMGDDYMGVFRTLGIRGIKRDPDWEEWHKYTNPQAKFNGEVGRIENIRLIENNHANAFSKTGSGDILGEGVIFGDDAVVMAEALAPELRAAVPRDFGREKAVAWYGLLEFGLVWDTGNAGEAKIVHVTSDA